jgi:hypothetical protein
MVAQISLGTTLDRVETNRKNILLPLKQLLQKAVPRQIKEYERLAKEYGDSDPHLPIRYLMIATGQLIENFEPDENSLFFLDELIEGLPLDWDDKVRKEISGRQSIAVSGLFRILFPSQNIESVKAFDVMDFLCDKLTEWGWQKTQNPRVFLNPGVLQLSLNLFGDE